MTATCIISGVILMFWILNTFIIPHINEKIADPIMIYGEYRASINPIWLESCMKIILLK